VAAFFSGTAGARNECFVILDGTQETELFFGAAFRSTFGKNPLGSLIFDSIARFFGDFSDSVWHVSLNVLRI
jgi:hypothetical protein